jgi:hypothetical protein
MRNIHRRFGILIAVGVAWSAVGCSAPCSETHSCETPVAASGGTAGTSAGADTHAGAGGDAGEADSGSVGTAGAGPIAGGSGDGGDAGRGGANCDTTRDPSVESCLVDDEYAVFVAPSGDDDEAGSKAAPVATLSKAIELAAGGKFVIVCDAKYDEHVTVGRGAQIYGGFKCSDWRTEAGSPLFKPTTPGPALSIDAVAERVRITHVDFEVADATSNGATALTAIVTDSPTVTFASVTLKAGKGRSGAIGTLATFTFADAGTLNGNAETSAGMGGASKTCLCQASLSSTGGVGGTPVAGGQSGSKGLPNLGGGLGGDPAAVDCGAGSGGRKGADASAKDPAPGAATLGSPTVARWAPRSGEDGATGSPGQGGGGGASLNGSGHGGGGACGGCGGNGAKAGKGGGGSIALLLVNSPVVLQSSTLTTGDAGDGGAGVAGQPGQAEIGSGGKSFANTNSCPGGNGGKGGAGGASGGGAGGISVGIVWKGATPPTLTDTVTTTGKAGAAGIGGVPGTNDGVSGVKQDLLQVP